MLKRKPANMNSKRSIQLIVDTVLSLLKTNNYRQITISEICREAEIVRNTFYAHFQTKDDVLKYYLFNIFEDEFYSIEKNELCSDITEVYFTVFNNKKEFLKILNKNNLLYLLDEFEHLFTLLDVDHYIDNNCNVSSLACEYAYTVYSAALSNIIKRWIKKGMLETPKELTSMFHELVV